ncbi:ROK family protein [Candidatus Bathyarchaeota archaeon]|nr:MAG: ROK family protein [Candidatus Bathyarchaeota archaeon]
MGRKIAVGVDLGGTNIRVALGNDEGRILAKISERTEKTKGPEGISEQIARIIRCLEKKEAKTGEIIGIGIGSAGPLDLKRGGLMKPTNIPYDFIPLVEPLEDIFHLPTYLLNDCSTAVMGEKFFGAGKNHENLAYITLSTGIGGGIYVDGHLLIGKDGNATEVGHFTIDYEGKLLCGCGKRGHWEAYCSGNGIPNYVRLLLSQGRFEGVKDSLLMRRISGDLDRLTAKILYDCAKASDPLALELVDKIGFLNSVGFACVVDAYDPSLITVGGSIALRNESLIIDPIRRGVKEHARNRVPEIKITPLGDDVVLYGALAMVFYPIK